MTKKSRASSLPHEESSPSQFNPPEYVRPGEYLLCLPPGVVLPWKEPDESPKKKQKKTVRFGPYRAATAEPHTDTKRG